MSFLKGKVYVLFELKKKIKIQGKVENVVDYIYNLCEKDAANVGIFVEMAARWKWKVTGVSVDVQNVSFRTNKLKE